MATQPRMNSSRSLFWGLPVANLGQKLSNTVLTKHCIPQVSGMKRPKKWRKWEPESNLCWALKQMKTGQALGNLTALTCEDALLSLYNKTRDA